MVLDGPSNGLLHEYSDLMGRAVVWLVLQRDLAVGCAFTIVWEHPTGGSQLHKASRFHGPLLRGCRSGSLLPIVSYDYCRRCLPPYCFRPARLSDLDGAGGTLRAGVSHPYLRILLRGELPEYGLRKLQLDGVASFPGVTGLAG